MLHNKFYVHRKACLAVVILVCLPFSSHFSTNLYVPLVLFTVLTLTCPMLFNDFSVIFCQRTSQSSSYVHHIQFSLLLINLLSVLLRTSLRHPSSY